MRESAGPDTTKPITKRVGALPLLPNGTLSCRASGKRCLRVNANYHTETAPRRSNRKSNSTSDGSTNTYSRAPRRVRFALPPTDGACVRNGVVGDSKSSRLSAGEKPRYSFSSFSTRPESIASHLTYAEARVPDFADILNQGTSVLVTSSPGVRNRVYPTGRYLRGTLSPTINALPHAAAPPGGQALLRAARDGDDQHLKDLLHNGAAIGIPEADLNAVDSSGRTTFSYIATNGTIDLLEQILQLPGLDPNKPDNEGNTPLHFAAQAGQIECLNCMLSRCRGIEIDARNNLGFTPLMKAALQGRNKCAKLLLFAGANPTLRDNGRGFRADQWARFCGRYVCADVIEKHARQRLLERSTSYGNWGGDNDVGARVLMGKLIPVPTIPQQQSHGLKSKLRKVFRTSSGPQSDTFSSARLVTQLTSAALCASSPVLPSGPNVPPVVKSLIRPLTVPRLQITLVNNNGDFPNNNLAANGKPAPVPPVAQKMADDPTPVIKPARTKKKK